MQPIKAQKGMSLTFCSGLPRIDHSFQISSSNPSLLVGVSTKSQLFDSLKVYLNKKNRLQPIIGLGSIVECVKAGTHNREALYLCEVCVCRLSKADVRNHIMGSFHRYKYIKAQHPHLVSNWKEDSDLSKMARPLMEKANILEGREGPGYVQLLEVEDAVYQMMTTCSENDAITLINILRDGQGEPESHSETTSMQQEHSPIQSHRIVLLSQNQPRSLQNSEKTDKQPSLIQSTVASFAESEDWSNDMPTSLLDNTQMSPDPSVLSEESDSFLDDYMGTKPLIGLFCVVECRGEDGHTYCFLCHCCRIRSNTKNIINHLTSSCHLLNYLMETRPEQVKVVLTDSNDNRQGLRSLAKRVEQEEGRGELKVVNVPESLCTLLTSNSYHWCVKMLCHGSTHPNIHKKTIAVKGPSVNQTLNQDIPVKCTAVLSEQEKRRRTKRKMMKVKNTVFKVSLPLTKGSVLLERTSFSKDSLPVSSPYSPPESQSEHCELDFDTGSFAVASEYQIGTKGLRVHVENNYNSQHVSPEGSSERLYKEWPSEVPPTRNDWLSPSEFHTRDWSSYNSSYRPEESCNEQWYTSTSQSNIGTSVDVSTEERQDEMRSDATQNYYRQQPQNQHIAGDHSSLAGQHGFSGESSWINTQYLGDSLAFSGNTATESRAQFPQSKKRQWQTYMELSSDHDQTAPQSYMTQPAAHQAIQVGHVVMSNNYYTGPVTNPDQHFPNPSVLWSTQ